LTKYSAAFKQLRNNSQTDGRTDRTAACAARCTITTAELLTW